MIDRDFLRRNGMVSCALAKAKLSESASWWLNISNHDAAVPHCTAASSQNIFPPIGLLLSKNPFRG